MTHIAEAGDIYWDDAMSDQEQIVAAVVKRAPDWLRRDLLSDDHVARAAAEEALSAMIASALAKERS